MLYWDESVNVSIETYSLRHIDVLINENLDGQKWRATFVYGEPRVVDRPRMWNKLRYIKGLVQDPWVVMVDFNEAAYQFKHFSASRMAEGQMLAF